MILVTGAAGKTGLAVLRALSSRNLAARALIRRPEQEKAVKQAGAVEASLADLEEPRSLATALAGTSAIYLICPNVHPREQEIGKKVVQAAQATGLPRVVYHSVLFPHIETMPHHWQKLRVEEALIQSGLDFTILQPASYMQNILPYWPSIMGSGICALPYSADAIFSPVDLDDVAEVAAKVLAEDGHAGATYGLAGPDPLSSREMTYQISQVLGREIIVEQISIADWQKSAKASGLDRYAIDALSRMFVYYDQYGLAGNARVLDALLGRPPTSFLDFLNRQAA